MYELCCMIIAVDHFIDLVAHPGMKHRPNLSSDDKRFHHYYLWVAFLLGIQAVSFAVPRVIWKAWSGSGIKSILEQKENESGESQETLSLFLTSKSHFFYYYKLLTCESLNLVNAVLQLIVMNSFLGLDLSHASYWYKEELLELFHEKRPFERTDIVEQIFPKVTSCTFYSYGPSGSVVNYQAV